MTAGPGRLVNFGGLGTGFVVWARPPVYFVQRLPNSGGQLPLISEKTQASLVPGEGPATQLRIVVGDSKLGRTFDYLDK